MESLCTAFVGTRRVAGGTYAEVALALKAKRAEMPLVFDDRSGRQIDFDLSGSDDDVVRRLTSSETSERGPGRPKLGVVAREVTLLPQQWDWLAEQPGGASAVLRKLVDRARRSPEASDRVKAARERAYRFMSAMAGDLPNFEEASRALFAGERERLEVLTAAWPADVRVHLLRLAPE